MTKERKEYLDSLWKDTDIGKFMIYWSQQDNPESIRKADEIEEKIFSDYKPQCMSIDDYNGVFAKDFAKAFKDYDEWYEYTDILFKESEEMKEAMRVSAVTNGFMFKVEEILLEKK